MDITGHQCLNDLDEKLWSSVDELRPNRDAAIYKHAVLDLIFVKDEVLKKISHELTEKLRKSTTVDRQLRESVRAKLRKMVRVLLRRYKYPQDKTSEAIELVLTQAEKLSEAWSPAA